MSLAMFRSLVFRTSAVATKISKQSTKPIVYHVRNLTVSSSRFGGGPKFSEDEIDDQIEEDLQRHDLDGWDIRRVFQRMQERDAVPEPRIIIAGLEACRRVNDFALAVRFLESVKYKTGPYCNDIWPWLMQEVGPTMKSLGVPAPEDIGYDKPEFFFAQPEERDVAN